MSYFFALGGLSTDKPFVAPTLNLLKEWYLEWSSKYDTSDYDVILTGSAAEYFFGPGTLKPNDTDIVLMNDIKDPEELYDIMYGGASIGLKHRLLIDIFHTTALYDSDTFTPYKQTRFYKTITYTGNRGQKVVRDLGSDQIIKEYKCGLVTYDRNKGGHSYEKKKERSQIKAYENLRINLKTDVQWK